MCAVYVVLWCLTHQWTTAAACCAAPAGHPSGCSSSAPAESHCPVDMAVNFSIHCISQHCTTHSTPHHPHHTPHHPHPTAHLTHHTTSLYMYVHQTHRSGLDSYSLVAFRQCWHYNIHLPRPLKPQQVGLLQHRPTQACHARTHGLHLRCVPIKASLQV